MRCSSARFRSCVDAAAISTSVAPAFSAIIPNRSTFIGFGRPTPDGSWVGAGGSKVGRGVEVLEEVFRPAFLPGLKLEVPRVHPAQGIAHLQAVGGDIPFEELNGMAMVGPGEG